MAFRDGGDCVCAGRCERRSRSGRTVGHDRRRGDDGFKELIAQFEKKTGRKVALRFPNFIESRDTIVKGEPFDVGIVEFPHDADVIASGNVVPGSATLIANGWMAVAVKKGAPKPDISTPSAVKRMLLNANPSPTQTLRAARERPG
jgi:ABC-type molybdate transport system substrate-binding protein